MAKSAPATPQFRVTGSPMQRRFERDEHGSVMVEFALTATPFLLMAFFIVEIGLMMIGDIVLHNAVAKTAMGFRSTTSAPLTSSQARARLCSEITVPLSCDERLVLDIRPSRNFNAGDQVVSGFDDGTAGEMLTVRASYSWSGITPMSTLMADELDGETLAAGALVRRARPVP